MWPSGSELSEEATLAVQHALVSASVIPVLGLELCPTKPGYPTEFWELNSDPPAYKENMLCSELFLPSAKQHSWLNEIYKWVFGTFSISISFWMKNLFIYKTKNSCRKGFIDKHVCLKCVIFLSSLLTHIAHLNAK